MKPIFRPIQSQDDAPLAAIIRKSLTDHQLAVPGTAYFDPELDHLSEFYAADPATRHYFVVTDESGTLLGGGGLALMIQKGKSPSCKNFISVMPPRAAPQLSPAGEDRGQSF